MPYQNISYVVPDAVRDNFNDLINQAMDVVRPFVINLTPEERKAYPKMGDKTIPFVEKSVSHGLSQPKLVPNFLDSVEWKKDVDLANQVRLMLAPLAILFDAIDDTYLAIGSEAYTESLTFYKSVQMAAKSNVPGADTVYQDLKARFPQRPFSVNPQKPKQ